jgi:lipid II:glycine glycyltransferase (peptidoglycan interpeptide bridge formation enzyme)
MSELSASEWDAFLDHFPDAHLLQTSAWGELKSDFGWQAVRLTTTAHGGGPLGAQVLFRRLPFGFNLGYLPKGPVSRVQAENGNPDWEALWPLVDQACRRRHTVFLKVEPDLWEPADGNARGDQGDKLPGARMSNQAIQPPRTLLVDIQGNEEQVLARMKQKTRYNIRLALKKGVIAYPSTDLDTFYRLLTTTGRREGFGVHSAEYYRRAYDLFHPLGECELLMAAYQGELLAGVMVFAHGCRAWYFYGASADEHRERMPAYLLQWEAMRWARSRGCTLYDLWGVPDSDERSLEAQFTRRSDGLWGVYRFKRGFGGQLRRSCGPWDRVYMPLPYALYTWWTTRRKSWQDAAG